MTAPMPVSVTASTRNCQRIVPRVAPSALRTPISRVRSVTEIIMIATTPTPPTSRPIADSTIMTRKNIAEDLVVHLEQLVLRDDREVVVRARAQPVPRAHRRDRRRPCASSRVTSVARHDRDADVVRTTRCSERMRRLERHDGPRPVAAGEEARLVVVDADHA